MRASFIFFLSQLLLTAASTPEDRAYIWNDTTKQFWYPESAPSRALSNDTVSNLLQLVAKIHEIIIIASLSSISISIFRRRLIGDGVRLGFLTGGYRVGDIEYICSSPFRHQGLKSTMPWEIFLVCLLVFATILSTIVGPVSAFLLLPSLGWFPLDQGSAFSNIQLPLITAVSREVAWPQSVSGEGGEFDAMPECMGAEGLYRASCLASGYSEIRNWVQTCGSTDLKNNLTKSLARAATRANILINLRISETRMTFDVLNALYSTYGGKLAVETINETHYLSRAGDASTMDRPSVELEGTIQEQIDELRGYNPMEFDFEVERWGYGSGRQRKTLTFAVVMMCIYLATVAIYALTVFGAHVLELLGRGNRLRVLSVVPWSDLQDLIVLALKTPTPKDADIADAGAGVSSSSVWKKTARLRADKRHNVRLVLNDETLTEELKVTGEKIYH